MLATGAGSAASLPGVGRLSLLTDARPRPSVTSRVPHCPSLPTTCCRGRGKSLERMEHRGGGSRGRPCRLRARPPWGRSPAVLLLHSLLVTRQETETEVPAVAPSSQNKISKPKQTSGSEPEAAPLRPAGRGSPASFRWGSTRLTCGPFVNVKSMLFGLGGAVTAGGGFTWGREVLPRARTLAARGEGRGCRAPRPRGRDRRLALAPRRPGSSGARFSLQGELGAPLRARGSPRRLHPGAPRWQGRGRGQVLTSPGLRPLLSSGLGGHFLSFPPAGD